MNLKSRALSYRMSGALGALAFVDDHNLFFGRLDRRLQIYDQEAKEVDDLLMLRRPAVALAVFGELIAVADRKVVTVLFRAAKHGSKRFLAAGALRLPMPPVWIKLEAARLTVLGIDGRLLRYPLSVTKVTSTSDRPPEA